MSDPFFPWVNTWMVALTLTLVVSFGLFVLTIYFCKLRSDLRRQLGWRRDVTCPGLGRTAPAVEEVKVTLDPDTAHPHLVLSEDQRSVTRRDTEQHLPDHPQRFTSMWCVLGHQGFTQGRYCWQVEVVWGGSWAVGIARESVRRKGWIFFGPEEGIWGVQRWDRVFWALTGSDRTRLSVPVVPSRIRVYLDCAGRQVRFLNADTEAPIFTFLLPLLTGDSVRPWFWAGDTGVQFIFSTAPLTQPCTVPERIS